MNSSSTFVTRGAGALALLAASGSALAHPGLQEAGAVSAFMHPFSGLDHLLAMLAVGAWAASGQRQARALPIVFIAGALLGVVPAVLGIALPALESMLAASVLALGLVLMARRGLSAAAALMLTAVIGAWHGNAHGLEIPGLPGLAPLGAFVAGTALLHLAGYAAGARLRALAPCGLRLAGSVLAVCGGWLLVA